jgi:hypothetical protein
MAEERSLRVGEVRQRFQAAQRETRLPKRFSLSGEEVDPG